MTYGNSKRMSGAAGCYCSELVDSTCDFCSGLRTLTPEQLQFVMNNIEEVANRTFGPVKVHDSYLAAALALVSSGKLRLISGKPGDIRVMSLGQ